MKGCQDLEGKGVQEITCTEVLVGVTVSPTVDRFENDTRISA